jgi:hypothetical protein
MANGKNELPRGGLPEGTQALLAVGAAGYALAMELLTTLKDKGLLSHDEAASVIDRTLGRA